VISLKEGTEHGTALGAAHFTDLAGKPRSLAEWQGHVLVVNFWATWCAPCREEIPAFVAVRGKTQGSGVEFVGIAVDHAEKVVEFARKVHISYPVLLLDASGFSLIRALGNPSGGLPFTVFLDARGVIVDRHLGALTQQTLEERLKRLLRA
jgi:thiol-disulfide isomerase/thioredoxin